MARSMTGYGAGEAAGASGCMRAEMRGVNGRFLEIRPRMPSMLISFEPEVRRLVGERVLRGRVDVTLDWQPSPESAPPFRINPQTARAYLDASRRLREELQLKGEMSLVDVLGLPGVVESIRGEEASPEMKDLAVTALGEALAALDAMRTAEGEKTVKDILGRLGTIEGVRTRIAGRADTVPAAAKRRLEERLARLGVETAVDPARLAQEVAYLADRADIAEELMRLGAHIGRSREALGRPREPVGKALEFLAQELHREINTIGSKNVDNEIAGWVLEAKAEIERIREQAQNLE